MKYEARDSTEAQPVDSPPQTIVAITGHRRLPDPVAVARSIRSVLAELAAAPTPALDAPCRLVLLSPLAEGADRLAAHEILRLPGGILRAVLPLAPQEYEKDFTAPTSRTEFHDLLARASDVEVIAPELSRADAYHAVGRRVVDDCDIVLAIWDGRPIRGAGGTAQVVALARARGKPLIIIDSEDPAQVLRERLSDAGNETTP